MGLERGGYMLWEGMTLLIVIFGGIGLMILRRKASGRPAFSDQDRQLFFSHSRFTGPRSKVMLKLGAAACLCSVVGLLELIILAPLGGALITGTMAITFLGIVDKLFR